MTRIGILYPGALGAALGKAVVRSGRTALTCLSGRSGATRERAIAAGFTIVPSLQALALSSEIVISVVPPNAVRSTARSFARAFDLQSSGGVLPSARVFIDINSVSPKTKQQVGRILSDVGLCCLDGTFFGPANRVGPDNLLVLSGQGTDRVTPILRDLVEVWSVGETIGQACSLKMAIGVMTKALCALFVETICGSAADGQLVAIVDLMRRLYPGTMGFVERSLTTYPAHVSRKIDELEEVVQWLAGLHQPSEMTRSAVAVLERFRRAGLEARLDWSFDDLLHSLTHSIPRISSSTSCTQTQSSEVGERVPQAPLRTTA